MKPCSNGREERLAAALRENLKRRKARARSRGNEPVTPATKTDPRAEERSSCGPNPAAKKS